MELVVALIVLYLATRRYRVVICEMVVMVSSSP